MRRAARGRGASVPVRQRGTALALLETQRLDLVIADIAMPGVDGYAFIARPRQRADMPAIAMTAHARIEDRRRALAAGYTAYRTKPIDGPQLAKTAREPRVGVAARLICSAG